MIVGVLVEISNRNVDKVFDYNVPDNLLSKIRLGIRVSVPFGRMKLEGFVAQIKAEKQVENVKDIIDVIDNESILNDELLELGKEMKKTTLAPLISCYQTMLPKALKAKKNTTINVKYDTYYKLTDNLR